MATIVLAQASATPAQSAAQQLDVHGECPTRSAVAAALMPVLGKDFLTSPSSAPPRVMDLGDRFEASAARQRAVYPDAARDCDERARIAAVFIALALSPPALQSSTDPNDPAAAREPGAPRPAAAVEESAATRTVASAPVPDDRAAVLRWLELSISARTDASAMGGPSATLASAWGGEARAALGISGYGLFVSSAVLSPVASSFGAVEVRQQRFPFAIGTTAHVRRRSGWQFGIDVGAAIAVFTLRAERLATSEPATRVDVGPRLAVRVGLPAVAQRWSPMIDLHAEYFPRRYVLDVDPVGTVGFSSRLWVGAALGITYRSERAAAPSR